MDATPTTLPWLSRPLDELLRLSMPIAVSMLSYSLMTLVDTWFMGRLGAEQLAGVGLGGTMSYALIAFAFGAMRGGKTLVSQAIGADRRSEVGAYLGAGLLTSVLYGLCVIVLQWPVGRLLAHFQASAGQAHWLVLYLMIRSFGAPIALVTNALREVRQGTGDSRSPMIAALVANIANALLGWLFIFPLHGGVAGAAWATVVAQTLEALVLAAYQHRFGWGISAMRREHLVALVRIGMPTGLQFMLEMGAFTLLAIMISSLSVAQMDAHQITLQLCAFSFLPAVAIGEGAAVMTGQVIGADRDELVLPQFRLAAGVVSAYTALVTIVLVAFAHPLVRQFSSDADTQRVTLTLVHMCGFFLIVDGINIVVRAVLRGTGDVVFPAWLGIICSWLMTPPLCWLLGFRFHMGVVGGWIGIVCEVLLGGLVMSLRLLRGGWKPFAAATRREVITIAG